MSTVETAARGFSVYDSKNTMVFDLDANNQTYKFFNETLLLEVQQGISIPPIARGKFNGKALVSPSSVSFNLFEQAMRHLFETELVKDGFRLIEKA